MESEQFLPHLAGLAAEAYLVSGNATDGLRSVEDGLRAGLRTGERFWQPELLRLKGELQIAGDPSAAPEAEDRSAMQSHVRKPRARAFWRCVRP